FGFDADVAEQLEERADVADVRDVLENDGLVGEQCRRERGQCGVLVASGPDGAPEWVSSLDDQLRHLRAPAMAPAAVPRRSPCRPQGRCGPGRQLTGRSSA